MSEKSVNRLWKDASSLEMTDREFVCRLFKNLFDLFDVFGQETINALKADLKNFGWSQERITDLEAWGAWDSNWADTKHVQEMVKFG